MKSRRGDTETRRRGEKTSRLRVSLSSTAHALKSTRNRIPAARRPRVSVSPRHRVSVITLLSDFGAADYFVGAMKGVILSVNPDARIVDITHEISPQDIAAGAFTLLAAYKLFPRGTIHVAIVDPGVGSSRRPLIVATGDQFFVGPDNGIFNYIIDRERDARVFHITNEKYFCHPVSTTFHGRDVFAPVAAALSLGAKAEKLGVEIHDYARLAPLVPARSKNGIVRARIIHIDHFGNCITNLTQQELTPPMIESGPRLRVNGKEIRTLRHFFSEAGAGCDQLFAVWGSAGFLEIAAMNQSAAKLLKAKRGQTVLVSTRP